MKKFLSLLFLVMNIVHLPIDAMQSQSHFTLDPSEQLAAAIENGNELLIKTLIEDGVKLDDERKKCALVTLGQNVFEAFEQDCLKPGRIAISDEFDQVMALCSAKKALVKVKTAIEAAEKTRAERDVGIKAALMHPEHIMPNAIADIIVSYKP